MIDLRSEILVIKRLFRKIFVPLLLDLKYYFSKCFIKDYHTCEAPKQRKNKSRRNLMSTIRMKMSTRRNEICFIRSETAIHSTCATKINISE